MPHHFVHGVSGGGREIVNDKRRGTAIPQFSHNDVEDNNHAPHIARTSSGDFPDSRTERRLSESLLFARR
jgi:hypothetical protein